VESSSFDQREAPPPDRSHPGSGAQLNALRALQPSGPGDAMVIVYAVDGRSSSLVVQVPSGPVCPATPSPLALTSVTVPSVPEDAFTVTWTLGATPVARSAGKTSSTVGGVTGAGVGAAGICCEPLVVELPEAAAEVPWQALSKTLRATSAAARPLPDRDPADGAFTSYRSQVKAAGRCSTEPPVRPVMLTDAAIPPEVGFTRRPSVSPPSGKGWLKSACGCCEGRLWAAARSMAPVARDAVRHRAEPEAA
jgi:hypothetical protein